MLLYHPPQSADPRSTTEFVFPNSHDMITLSPEPAPDTSVSASIAVDLLVPEFGSIRRHVPTAYRTGVPETTVNEHGQARRPKEEIGTAGNGFQMFSPAGYLLLPENLFHPNLSRLVPNAPHFCHQR